jgi:hypothetical protein
MVRGHSFAHDTRCPRVGKPGHVQPYFGEDDLRTMWPDAGDLIEASHRRQQRGLGAPSRQVGVDGDQAAVGGVAVAGFGGLRVGHGGQQLFDAGGEDGDLHGEGVDLIEQHPREFGVVVVEPSGQRLGHGGPLDLQLAARQIGEPMRVAFPGDQRLQHVPH